MKPERILEAKAEAERFLKRVNDLIGDPYSWRNTGHLYGTKRSGSVRIGPEGVPRSHAGTHGNEKVMVTNPQQVVLTPSEVSFCVTLAGLRYAAKPARLIDSRYAKDKTSFGVHLFGVTAETAAAKSHGIKIDQAIRWDGDGHKPDLVTRDGKKIEVKAVDSKLNPPLMKLNPEELVEGVEYVLVTVSLPDVCLVYPPIGIVDVRRLSTRRDFGFGERIVVDAGDILRAAA